MIGELQSDPGRLFVVWAIGRSFCRTKLDFADHFGSAVVEALPEFESDGFVFDHEGLLCLTDLGRRAVAALRTLEEPPLSTVFAGEDIESVGKRLPAIVWAFHCSTRHAIDLHRN